MYFFLCLRLCWHFSATRVLCMRAPGDTLILDAARATAEGTKQQRHKHMQMQKRKQMQTQKQAWRGGNQLRTEVDAQRRGPSSQPAARCGDSSHGDTMLGTKGPEEGEPEAASLSQ